MKTKRHQARKFLLRHFHAILRSPVTPLRARLTVNRLFHIVACVLAVMIQGQAQKGMSDDAVVYTVLQHLQPCANSKALQGRPVVDVTGAALTNYVARMDIFGRPAGSVRVVLYPSRPSGAPAGYRLCLSEYGKLQTGDRSGVIKTITVERPFPLRQGDAVARAWKAMLESVESVQGVQCGLDGEVLVFSSLRNGHLLCGEVWSPHNGPPKRLEQLGHRLADYCRDDSGDAEGTLKAIEALAEAIVSDLVIGADISRKLPVRDSHVVVENDGGIHLWVPRGGLVDFHLLGGVPLVGLYLQDVELANIEDLSSRSLLENLVLSGTAIEDLSPLRSLIRLKTLYLDGTPIRSLEPIADLPIEVLDISDTPVRDVKDLAHLPLFSLKMTIENVETGLTMLGSIETLRFINGLERSEWPTEVMSTGDLPRADRNVRIGTDR